MTQVSKDHLPPGVIDEAMEQIEDMIKKGQVYIAPSPFNSNMVAVPKPIARGETKPKLRLTLDHRKLNSRTVAIKFSFGSTFDALEAAGGEGSMGEVAAGSA